MAAWERRHPCLLDVPGWRQAGMPALPGVDLFFLGLFGRRDGLGSVFCGMHNLRLAHYDEPPPQRAQVSKGLEQTPEVEELRFPISPVIVINGGFRESQPRVLKALYHLNANCSAGRGEPNAVIACATHQSEIAVHVSDLYSEGEPDHTPINCADEDPMPRIGAADLVPIHD